MHYIPEGFSTITPFIMAKDPNRVMEFVKKAFDAEEIAALRDESGVINHAQIKIGDSMIMLGNAMGQNPGMPCAIYLYTPNMDEFYERALAAGGSSVSAPADQFYGDRNGGVKDPEGNIWWIATCKEHLSFDEVRERARKLG